MKEVFYVGINPKCGHVRAVAVVDEDSPAEVASAKKSVRNWKRRGLLFGREEIGPGNVGGCDQCRPVNP